MISSEPTERLSAWKRTASRYLLPKTLVSLILFVRDGAKVSPSSRVQLTRLLRLGKGSVVKSQSILTTSGGRIVLGSGCAVGYFNYLAAGAANIIIGDNVRMGPHVSIIASTRKYRSRKTLIKDQGFQDKGIRIGNDVLIGANSVIVDGADIGEGAVIGVGSIVTGKVKPYAVVFGAPAKVIFSRN